MGMTRDRAPTIIDVARLSGVSKSTVSNVLRGRSNVAGETRQRVLAAIGELGYRPNQVARSLVRRSTDTLGLLIGDLSNSYFGEVLGQVQRLVAEMGFLTTVGSCGLDPDDELKRLEAFFEQRVGGLLLLQYSGASIVEELLDVAPVPVVAVTCRSRVCDAVCTDDRLGERLITEHLLTLGHQRIAFVSDLAVDPQTNEERRRGYEQAIGDAGLLPGAWGELSWSASRRLAAGQAMVELVRGPQGPTAIVATSDDAAIAVIDTLEASGVSVPRDLSVVGFDGVSVGALGRIGLTTVVQDTETIARKAIEVLKMRLEGSATSSRHDLIEPTLAIRHSTAPPAAG